MVISRGCGVGVPGPPWIPESMGAPAPHTMAWHMHITDAYLLIYCKSSLDDLQYLIQGKWYVDSSYTVLLRE